MLIANEKFACDACIRGHRVSSCNHSDRPLHKVAPKGRPVSQCTHCRSLRKARAQHVKCDCSEKGHSEADCPQKKADHKLDQSNCCCSHGSRCSCALKKEHHKEHHLESVPEDAMCDMATPESFDIKPRSSLSTPDGKPTNGHHKPVKHNDAAHTRGLPYTIPRSHSIHGHSELAQRSVDSLPHTKRSLISHDTPQHHDSITSAPQPVRRVKSEHGSPTLNASTLAPINTAFPPLDSTCSPFGVLSGTNSPATSGLPYSIPDQFPDSYFGYPAGSQDLETPLHSADLYPTSVDWSSFNLPYDINGEYATAPSQPPSYASYEYSHLGHPGLTSSSGEISEAEDWLSESANNATTGLGAADMGKYEDVNVDQVDVEPYRLSSASSMMNLPHNAGALNLLKQENTASMDIDEVIKRAEERTLQMNRQRANTVGSNMSSNRSTPPKPITPQQTPLHGLTVREAQNFAHMNGSDGDSDEFNLQQTGVPNLTNVSGEDPMWSNPEMTSPEDVKWVQ